MDVNERLMFIYKAISELTKDGWDVNAYSYQDASKLRVRAEAEKDGRTVEIGETIEKERDLFTSTEQLFA